MELNPAQGTQPTSARAICAMKAERRPAAPPPNNDADNPQIRILAPPLGKALTSPLDIELQFVPTGSAPIRPDTFRICYLGSIPMDITKRITDRIRSRRRACMCPERSCRKAITAC